MLELQCLNLYAGGVGTPGVGVIFPMHSGAIHATLISFDWVMFVECISVG